MALFTVTWRDNGDDFMVTTVDLDDRIDPKLVTYNEWVDLAWTEENTAAGIPEDEWGTRPSVDGYDLISIVVGVPEFIY